MATMRTVCGTSAVRVLAIGCLVALAVILCRQAGVLEALELGAYDWTVRLSPYPTHPDPRVVVITITEEDIQEFQQWPLSDENVSDALNRLLESGARTIGLDLYRDIEVPPGRASLNSVLTKHREIVTVMKFPDKQGRGIPGPAVLQGSDQVGFNDILVDPGGIVRRGFLFLEHQNQVATSFALALALRYLEQEGVFPEADPNQPEYIKIGTVTIPLLKENDGSYVGADIGGYQFLARFAGSHTPFHKYSLTSLLDGKIDPIAIKDKLVIIGTAAQSVRDDFYTPFSQGRHRDQQMPGVELHAHLASQFLRMGLDREQPLVSPSETLEMGWILLWGSLGGLMGLWLRSPWRLIVLLATGVGVVTLFVYEAYQVGWWVPLVSPVLAWLLSGSIAMAFLSKREHVERTQLMQLFSQHVSPEVAEKIWNARAQFLEEGRIRPQQLTVTVLFADLEGFTSMAEKLPPAQVMEWLNAYIDMMATVIAQCGGVVDDFFGDGVKANFGVPIERTTPKDIQFDAVNAVQCGLTLQKELSQLHEKYHQQGMPRMNIRIGVSTGLVVVGSLGSAQRLKYTTIGDTVNIAARLEQLGKEEQRNGLTNEVGSLIVSEETFRHLDSNWQTQKVGPVSLQGKSKKIMAYRIFGGPPITVKSKT